MEWFPNIWLMIVAFDSLVKNFQIIFHSFKEVIVVITLPELLYIVQFLHVDHLRHDKLPLDQFFHKVSWNLRSYGLKNLAHQVRYFVSHLCGNHHFVRNYVRFFVP